MKDLETLRTQYRVTDFIAWKRQNLLELNPNFQRRPVWKKGAKSYLIDTIIRGLPMPIIFVRDLQSNLEGFTTGRDVVDGQQRLRTVLSFVDPKLLDDFKVGRDDFKILKVHNEKWGGKSFHELPSDIEKKILSYQFSVHSFPADTDDREILQIFARMNATGVKLNRQELRNARYYGKFKTLSYELATEQLNRWRDWKVFSLDKIARMNEVELTSELMIMMLSGNLEKDPTIIDKYYKDYDRHFVGRAVVAQRFRKVFDTIEGLLARDEISDLIGGRTIFFPLFVAVYGLLYSIRTTEDSTVPLSVVRPKSIPNRLAVKIRAGLKEIAERRIPDRILKALTGHVTHASERRAVIEHLVGKDSDPCPKNKS